MLVIIPHPNQEAQIKKLQNELCDSININNDNSQKVTKLFPVFPLWFEFEKDDELISIKNKNELKEFSKKITGVELNIKSSSDNYKLSTSISDFVITLYTKEKIFTAVLPICIEYQKLTDKEKELCLKKLNSSELLPMSLKIFRLGNKQQLTEHSQALDYFIWKKLI